MIPDPRPSLPRVALVQPPFGAGIMPGLGTALLSAELQARGARCRVFYWDLELLAGLPGRTPRERFQGFSEITSGVWFPFNEWVFTRVVHDDRLDHQAEATRVRLLRLSRTRRAGEALARHLLALRDDALAVVDRMVEQLDGFDVVGIGTTFFQNTAALALARRVKARWPRTTVVLGGANCDGGMGAALLEHFPFVDHVFAGEVDLAFPEYVQTLRAASAPAVPGLVRREHGRVVGAPAPPLADLDRLPVPAYDDYVEAFTRAGLDSFLKLTVSLESSRGCWWGERHHCTFCGLNAGGMAFRRKHPDRFAGEVEEVVRRWGVRYLYMTDNIVAPEYYTTFLERVKGSRAPVEFFYEIKSNVTRKQVSRLAGGGVSYIKPGIEHFSSAILARMRKGVTGIQNVALLRLAREHGVLVDYAILVGFPGEEIEEYDRLARELPKLTHLRPPVAVTPVQFHRFSPYHSDPQAFGLALRPWSEYAALYPLPEEEIARLAYVFETSRGVPEGRGYLGQLLEQVRRWLALYSEDRCTLTWAARGAEMAVTDGRPGFGPRRFRLQDFAPEVLRRLDEPRSLSGLVRAVEADGAPGKGAAPVPLEEGETPIVFSRADFLADPARCLAPLLETALVFEERLARAPGQEHGAESYLLALPVPEDRRPANLEWLVY